jgi:long-chain acyl-CoA synthetase
MSLLITGATGFLGREVLSRYLERTDAMVYALVRAPDAEAADKRLRDGLRAATGTHIAGSERLEAVPGDVQADGLGLDVGTRDRLAGEVDTIIHSAASVSFTLPLGESREINVRGTRNMIEFAARCEGLRRFTHVSTAYVAGTHAGRFGESDFDVGQDFRNAYEQSKFEAERVVREAADRLPVQIVRPSIVVGERASGWTGSFNVLYSPLKVLARGGLPAVPARSGAPVDVVPVDFVADAIHELASGGENRTYHLVSGSDATTVGRLVALAAERLDQRRPRMLAPLVYRLAVGPLLKRTGPQRRRRAVEQMEVFFPYFAARVEYDDSVSRAALAPAGVAPGNVEGYFGRLVAFAQKARWGKVAVTRERARALALERLEVARRADDDARVRPQPAKHRQKVGLAQ